MDRHKKYSIANEQLEKRLFYLWEKGELTLYGGVEKMLKEKKDARNNPIPESDPRHLLNWFTLVRNIYTVNGIEETVESSSDEKLKHYYGECKKNNGISIARVSEHFESIRQAETELLARTRNERYH